MQIRSLTAFEVPIPLRKPIRHASHMRHANDTLLIRCQLSDGTVGWGEGLPRIYVTGESMESAWRHVVRTDLSGVVSTTIDSPIQAVAALDSLQLADVEPDTGVIPRQCFGNSVRCALELAVLDAVCRSQRQSIGEVIHQLSDAQSVLSRQSQVFYSGAITSMSPRKQWVSAWKMRLFGFGQVKVKVGAAGIDDRACMARIRGVLGPAVDLRIDANEAWHCDQVVDKMKLLSEFHPSSLEQPVPHSEVHGLAAVRKELTVPIMLDESLCCHDDARQAIDQGTCDLFNLRLSKCGGIVACVRLAALARKHRLGYQLGCQVGETGILSAAGRHLACNIADIRYLEGSYDRFLVRESLTDSDLTFSRRGRAPRLDGPGLGVTVNENRVHQLTVRRQDLLS